MPYKSQEAHREYMRKWISKRRAEFFENQVCFVCGTGDNLELHHIDPSTKEHHAIWSWSKNRRDAETAKCAVLCRECHVRIHHDDKVERQTVVKPDDQGMYRCNSCGEVLPVAEFVKSSRRPMGFQPECKQCMIERERSRRGKI